MCLLSLYFCGFCNTVFVRPIASSPHSISTYSSRYVLLYKRQLVRGGLLCGPTLMRDQKVQTFAKPLLIPQRIFLFPSSSATTPPVSCFKLAAQEDFFAQKLMRRNTVLENHQNSLILQLYELSPHDYSMSLWSKL